jgi:hypothetical protein
MTTPAVDRCRAEVPALRPLAGTAVAVACHRADERLAGLALPIAPPVGAAARHQETPP